MGVILSHRSLSYINEGGSKKAFSSKQLSGPRAHVNDQCSNTYDKSYYIHALGTECIMRPTNEKLIFVVSGSIEAHPIFKLI